MTAPTRSRTFLVGAAAAALTAPMIAVLALAGSASASIGPRPHEVTMYKVERQVELSSEFPDSYGHEDLSCNNGDIALDGMWRVDHVDQYQPDQDDPNDPSTSYNDERDVVFYASYPDSSHDEDWHFRFENLAEGNAQVKLFLTCIKGQTEANAGHSHKILVSPVVVDGSHHSQPVGASEWDGTQSCDPGYYAVAPGFNFVHDEYNRIFRNWPTANYRGWHWAFVVSAPNPDVDVYLRCLSNRVKPAGPNPKHTHKIPMTWKPGFSGYNYHLTDYGTQERQWSCDTDAPDYSNYKAMVGAFWIDDPHHVWYLGMDPRPKTRAYSFWYDHSGYDSVYVSTFCVRARTGNQIKP